MVEKNPPRSEHWDSWCLWRRAHGTVRDSCSSPDAQDLWALKNFCMIVIWNCLACAQSQASGHIAMQKKLHCCCCGWRDLGLVKNKLLVWVAKFIYLLGELGWEKYLLCRRYFEWWISRKNCLLLRRQCVVLISWIFKNNLWNVSAGGRVLDCLLCFFCGK